MDRRTALRNIALTTGSITLLARCGFGEERLPIALNNLNVSVEQEDLLKEIVGVIIPETDIPGAASLEVHNFVWVMADDCMEKADQNRFMKGLSQFNTLLKHDRDTDFESTEAPEKAGLLEYVMNLDDSYEVPVDGEGNPEFDPESVKYALSRIKGFTIQGFMQSKYVMENEMPYRLVPGPAKGCVDVDPEKRVNIYG